jgi:hypothetical protein
MQYRSTNQQLSAIDAHFACDFPFFRIGIHSRPFIQHAKSGRRRRIFGSGAMITPSPLLTLNDVP